MSVHMKLLLESASSINVLQPDVLIVPSPNSLHFLTNCSRGCAVDHMSQDLRVGSIINFPISDLDTLNSTRLSRWLLLMT